MRKMTKANLEAAFAGESQAAMKYTIYADKAEREGYIEVAKLFRAIAYAERVHATNHFRALSKLNETSINLLDAADGENYEVEEMYPAFEAVAQLQEEKTALRSIFYAIEAEKIHFKMYNCAKESVDQKKDIEAKDVYVCPVCGHTVMGDLDDDCPICKAKKEKYIKF
ncbi:MAG: rubrerythrin family protein [Syntrophothermus sp.]|nr:rubrerythrin family protein [Ignavibacteriaceae bacterium]